MIDKHGFRANVGIILLNDGGQVFCARRCGMSAWQFPQGGIKRHETPERAMFRELREEIGLEPDDVEVLGASKGLPVDRAKARRILLDNPMGQDDEMTPIMLCRKRP